MFTQQQRTLQRIRLREPLVLGPESLKSYIMRFGLKGKAEGGLSGNAVPPFQETMSNVKLSLLMNALDIDKGPYADRDGAVAGLSNEILQDLGDEGPMGVLERVMDRLRPFDGTVLETSFPRFNRFIDTTFTLDPLRLASDELPDAGTMAADSRRGYGDGRFAITHPMETLVLAVAVLRHNGFQAYPGRAYMGEEEENPFSPIIALLDFEGAELTTFRMIRAHPDIVHMDLMSDTAVMGALHAMRAIYRANHLATENVVREVEGHPLSYEDTDNQLDRIADDLYRYCIRWDEEGPEKTMLLFQSFDGITSHIVQTDAWVRLRKMFSRMDIRNMREDLFLASRGIVKEAPELPINPPHLGMLLDMDNGALEHYPKLADSIMREWRKASETARTAVDAIRSKLESRLERKIAELA